MESNLNIKKSDVPKFNVTTVSSAVFGKEEGGSDIKGDSGKSIRNIHKTLSKLSGHLRNSLVRIKALEGKFSEVETKLVTNIEKITRIKKIIKEQKNNIGKKLPGTNQDNLNKTLIEKKLPGTNQDNLNKTLIETNEILVKIQQELTKNLSIQIKNEKDKEDKLKRSQSKKKLQAEESGLENSAKKLGSSVEKTSNAIITPVKSIFDRIMDFVGTLAIGIGSNAIFEWLKDEKNREKVVGWFDWIKDHWQWVALGIGAIFALPLVGAISGVIGTIGSLVGVVKALATPLLGLMLNPLFWKILLAVGAGVLIYKGGEFLLKKARNLVTGGEDYSTAHSQLDQQLADAGMGKDGRTARGRGRSASKSGTTGRDEEQEKIFQEVKKKREALYALKDQMNEEIKDKQSKLEVIPTPSGSRRRKMGGNPNESARSKVDIEVGEAYKAKISNTLNPTTVEARKMGGPVSAKTPYLVGERGPEIFAPNVDGSVINNMKTEKIYNMITSRKRSRGGTNIQTLPTITNQLPPPELPSMGGQATDVPEISSANMSNPYRHLTPMLYGITV